MKLKDSITICLDDLSETEIADFMDEHIAEMKDVTPPGSKHALDIDALRCANIRFWTVREHSRLVACGGLLQLNDTQGEIKAMRTHVAFRGKGMASILLEHILAEAKSAGLDEVLLETGSFPFFAPARALYLKHGFACCEPFGTYTEDPNSVFMVKRL